MCGLKILGGGGGPTAPKAPLPPVDNRAMHDCVSSLFACRMSSDPLPHKFRLTLILDPPDAACSSSFAFKTGDDHYHFFIRSKMTSAWVTLVLTFMTLYSCHGQEYPFRNTSLSFEDRVKVTGINFT